MFKPYNKTNNIPRYVNAKLNHPPSMLKEIPKSVSKRILSSSCNEQVYNVVATIGSNIFDKCGYSEKLTLEKEQYTHKRINRGRNIIWYNPTFSKNVKPILRNNFYTYWINVSVETSSSIQLGSIMTFCPLGYFWAWRY